MTTFPKISRSEPLRASLTEFLATRPPGADEDVHMLRSIVAHTVETYSLPGDIVLDPFAGFGTTLEVALHLGRTALGVELLPERVDYLHQRVSAARVVEGDARGLQALMRQHFPGQSVDLVLTSPPYMTENHHEADPLTAYERDGGNYARYLSELELVAAQCARLVKPGGYVVWNVADIEHMGSTTHLIADCSRVLSGYLDAVTLTEVVWDVYPHDLVADALLVFRRPVM